MKNLEYLRKAKGFSQEYVARYLGITRATYNSWEKGKTEPTATFIKELAKFFGVTTDYLLG